MISCVDWTCGSLWCRAFHEACGAGWSISKRIWGGFRNNSRNEKPCLSEVWLFFLQANRQIHQKNDDGTVNSCVKAIKMAFCLWLAAYLRVRIWVIDTRKKNNIYSSLSISSHRENKNILLLSTALLPRQQPSGVQETSVLESRARFEIRKRQKRMRGTETMETERLKGGVRETEKRHEWGKQADL